MKPSTLQPLARWRLPARDATRAAVQRQCREFQRLGAPRRGVNDPHATWARSNVIPRGHRTYLEVKTKGERSMFGKPGSRETTKRSAGQDPDGRVKAELPEPQCPICKLNGPDTVGKIRCPQDSRPNQPAGEHAPRGQGRRLAISRARTGHPHHPKRRSRTKRGIPYRARAPWERRPRSSRRTGKPSTRRRGSGESDEQMSRYV